MKVPAAENDPGRRLEEMADILSLMRATELAAEAVRPYFERHGRLDDWKRIRDSV